MKQFCAYTTDRASMLLAIKLIQDNAWAHEIHINRTRFWVDPQHKLYSFVALRFRSIDHETDHGLGT